MLACQHAGNPRDCVAMDAVFASTSNMAYYPGNPLKIGHIVSGQGACKNKMLTLSEEGRREHIYITGLTGSGKSKILESFCIQDIDAWSQTECGTFVFDYHGLVVRNLMTYLARYELNRPVVLIDLSQQKWVVAYNTLRAIAEADPGVLGQEFVGAVTYVMGESNPLLTPRINRVMGTIGRSFVETGCLLPDVVELLERDNKELRKIMARALTDPMAINTWLELNWRASSVQGFTDLIDSTMNRLHNFLGVDVFKTMFGIPDVSFDARRAMDEGWIVLINLSTERNRIAEANANLFACLMLKDIWAAARARGKFEAGEVKPTYLVLDEFQNFVTPTLARNLNEARGYGLSLCMAHQYPMQLQDAGENGKQLYNAVMANCKSKIVFEMDAEENLRPLADGLFRGIYNSRNIKHTLEMITSVGSEEVLRTSRGRSQAKGVIIGEQESHGHARGKSSSAALGMSISFDGAGSPISTAEQGTSQDAESDVWQDS